VIGRIDQVAIMVTGASLLSSEYAQFTTLLATMVNRVVQAATAPSLQGPAGTDEQG